MKETPQQSQSDFVVLEDSGTSRVSSAVSPTDTSLPATLPFVFLSALVDASMFALPASSPSRSSVTGESWGTSTSFFSASTTSDGNLSSVTFVSAVYFMMREEGGIIKLQI